MSKLGDHLVGELTGGRGTRPLPSDFLDRARALWRAAGSQRRAAELAGVDRRTFQRWFERERQGRPVRPRPGTPAKIGTGLRRAQLDSGRPTDRTFEIKVRDRKPHARDRGVPRERTLTARQLRLAPGTMGRLADVWTRTGDPEAVAAAFLAGVREPFYRRWLAPAPADRDRPPADAAPEPADEGVLEPPDVEEGPAPLPPEEEDEVFEDAYDEFFDLIYEGADEDIPEDYGADPS